MTAIVTGCRVKIGFHVPALLDVLAALLDVLAALLNVLAALLDMLAAADR